MIRQKRSVQPAPKAGEFWIARHELARAQASRFYDSSMKPWRRWDFAAQAHGLCAPLYSSGAKGRPPIDPAVYFKMLNSRLPGGLAQ